MHRMTAKKEKWAQEGSEFTTSITRGESSKADVKRGKLIVKAGKPSIGAPRKGGLVWLVGWLAGWLVVKSCSLL